METNAQGEGENVANNSHSNSQSGKPRSIVYKKNDVARDRIHQEIKNVIEGTVAQFKSSLQAELQRSHSGSVSADKTDNQAKSQQERKQKQLKQKAPSRDKSTDCQRGCGPSTSDDTKENGMLVEKYSKSLEQSQQAIVQLTATINQLISNRHQTTPPARLPKPNSNRASGSKLDAVDYSNQSDSVRSLSPQGDSLKDEISKLRQQVAEAVIARKKEEDQCKAKASEDAIKTELQQLKKELGNLKAEKIKVVKGERYEVSDSRDEVRKLRDELLNMKATFGFDSALKEIQEKYEYEKMRLEKELIEMEETIISLKTEAHNARFETEKLKIENSSLSRLKEAKDKLEAVVEEQRFQVESLRSVISCRISEASQTGELSGLYTQEKSKLAQTEAELRRLRKDTAALLEKNLEYETVLTPKLVIITEEKLGLESELKNLQTRFANVQKQFDIVNQQREEILRKNVLLKSECRHYKEQGNAMNQEIAKLRKMNSDIVFANRHLENELDECRLKLTEAVESLENAYKHIELQSSQLVNNSPDGMVVEYLNEACKKLMLLEEEIKGRFGRDSPSLKSPLMPRHKLLTSTPRKKLEPPSDLSSSDFERSPLVAKPIEALKEGSGTKAHQGHSSSLSLRDRTVVRFEQSSRAPVRKERLSDSELSSSDLELRRSSSRHRVTNQIISRGCSVGRELPKPVSFEAYSDSSLATEASFRHQRNSETRSVEIVDCPRVTTSNGAEEIFHIKSVVNVSASSGSELEYFTPMKHRTPFHKQQTASTQNKRKLTFSEALKPDESSSFTKAQDHQSDQSKTDTFCNTVSSKRGEGSGFTKPRYSTDSGFTRHSLEARADGSAAYCANWIGKGDKVEGSKLTKSLDFQKKVGCEGVYSISESGQERSKQSEMVDLSNYFKCGDNDSQKLGFETDKNVVNISKILKSDVRIDGNGIDAEFSSSPKRGLEAVVEKSSELSGSNVLSSLSSIGSVMSGVDVSPALQGKYKDDFKWADEKQHQETAFRHPVEKYEVANSSTEGNREQDRLKQRIGSEGEKRQATTGQKPPEKYEHPTTSTADNGLTEQERFKQRVGNGSKWHQGSSLQHLVENNEEEVASYPESLAQKETKTRAAHRPAGINDKCLQLDISVMRDQIETRHESPVSKCEDSARGVPKETASAGVSKSALDARRPTSPSSSELDQYLIRTLTSNKLAFHGSSVEEEVGSLETIQVHLDKDCSNIVYQIDTRREHDAQSVFTELGPADSDGPRQEISPIAENRNVSGSSELNPEIDVKKDHAVSEVRRIKCKMYTQSDDDLTDSVTVEGPPQLKALSDAVRATNFDLPDLNVRESNPDLILKSLVKKLSTGVDVLAEVGNPESLSVPPKSSVRFSGRAEESSFSDEFPEFRPEIMSNFATGLSTDAGRLPGSPSSISSRSDRKSNVKSVSYQAQSEDIQIEGLQINWLENPVSGESVRVEPGKNGSAFQPEKKSGIIPSPNREDSSAPESFVLSHGRKSSDEDSFWN